MYQSISIIVCTYNRAESLSVTLDSLSELLLPPSMAVEIVVVDNNSSDGTAGTIQRYCTGKNSRFKYVHEPKQGLSNARNAGIDNAGGDIIVFTDDDVLVDKNWLLKIVEAFVEHGAECVGGKIVPLWPGEKPAWVSKNIEYMLAVFDWGDEIMEFKTEYPAPYGANMAFSRRILREIGSFNTTLGRKGSKLYCGEDTEMALRVLKSKGKIVYQPHAVVHHMIDPNRLHKSYFRKWQFEAGEGHGAVLGASCARNILSIPYYIIREFALCCMKYSLTCLSFNADNIFTQELKVLYYMGFIRKRIDYHLCGSFDNIS